jgi:hypothetical protein
MTREWECWDCGHIFKLEKRPHICPKCLNVNKRNEEAFFIELPQTRKPGEEFSDDEESDFYPLLSNDQILMI